MRISINVIGSVVLCILIVVVINLPSTIIYIELNYQPIGQSPRMDDRVKP